MTVCFSLLLKILSLFFLLLAGKVIQIYILNDEQTEQAKETIVVNFVQFRQPIESWNFVYMKFHFENFHL